jgi:HSP20 family protein
MLKKRSFFSKLTGSDTDDFDDFFDDKNAQRAVFEGTGGERRAQFSPDSEDRSLQAESDDDALLEGDDVGGELAVDVYQTPDAIVVKALVAGVQPSSIDIALTREMLTISGHREDERETEDENYFQRELYWGSFSRTMLLPEEIDVDLAEATEKHGILMIRLPKINKKRQTKLKVKSR